MPPRRSHAIPASLPTIAAAAAIGLFLLIALSAPVPSSALGVRQRSRAQAAAEDGIAAEEADTVEQIRHAIR